MDEAPRPPLGKEARRTVSGHRTAEAPQGSGTSSSPAQDEGLLLFHPTLLAEGLNPETSAAALGPLPVSNVLHNAAQQLQNVAQRVALQQAKSAAIAAPIRLLPPKQLETICVQVQPEETKAKERSELSLAVSQSNSATADPPLKKNSRILGLSVINPQIIQVQPVTGTGPQQFLLYNSSEPTLQIHLQRPLHPIRQVSVGEMTHGLISGQKNKSVSVAAANSSNLTVASSCSANTLVSHERKKKNPRVKKCLNVKTRSGRISRPPKYKAKDYKFIKTEDLADCHQSDSDDYSELSLEDDEDGKEKEICSIFTPLNYDLKPKLFKCQSCEKSYIGKGGLARHYKLNPDHGQQEPSQSSSVNKPHGMSLLECTGKAGSENMHQPLSSSVTVTLINENGLAVDLKKDLPTQSEQESCTSAEDGKFAEHQNTHLLHLGRKRSRQPRRCGRPKTTKRSRYSGRFSRPGQFSSKSLNNMSTEHHSIFKRKARLKELIQQCASEDFIEIAVPWFTTLVTVSEFLLMKVEKNYPAKAFFREVYREFEELHAVVKKMCEDYFSNPELSDPLEIKNSKVAESLGIADSCLGVQKSQAIDSLSECTKTSDNHVHTEILGQKRSTESSDKLLPSPKKFRMENLLENVNISLNRREIKEQSSAHQDGGFILEQNCAANICSGNALQQNKHHESLQLEGSNKRADMNLYHQSVQVNLESLQPSGISGWNNSSCLTPCSKRLSLVSMERVQEKPLSANSGCNAARRLSVSEFCNSTISEKSSQNSASSMHEENRCNEKCQELQEEEVLLTYHEHPKDSESSSILFSNRAFSV